MKQKFILFSPWLLKSPDYAPLLVQLSIVAWRLLSESGMSGRVLCFQALLCWRFLRLGIESCKST